MGCGASRPPAEQHDDLSSNGQQLYDEVTRSHTDCGSVTDEPGPLRIYLRQKVKVVVARIKYDITDDVDQFSDDDFEGDIEYATAKTVLKVTTWLREMRTANLQPDTIVEKENLLSASPPYAQLVTSSSQSNLFRKESESLLAATSHPSPTSSRLHVPESSEDSHAVDTMTTRTSFVSVKVPAPSPTAVVPQ